MTRDRMRNTVAVAGVAACVLLDARPSAAPGLWQEPIADLVAAADVIVVATLATPPGDRGVTGLRLAVKRTLKGPHADVLDAVSAAPLFAVPGREIHGLWFLKAEGASKVVLPHRRPAQLTTDVVIGLPTAAPAPTGGSREPLDRVAAELLAAMRSPADAEAVAPAFGAAFDIAWTFEEDAAAERPQTRVASRTVTELTRALDAGVVARVEAEIAAGRHDRLPMELALGLYRLADPAVAPGVIRLARATRALPDGDDPQRRRLLHRAAVQALRNIHSAEMLPVLAELLDSPDLEIAYFAVMAFGEHALGYPPHRGGGARGQPTGPYARSAVSRHMPAYRLFMAGSPYYLDFWRRWYACLPCRLESGAPSVTVTGTGTCSGVTCNILFRAAPSDPDGDNVFVEGWSGCEVGAADPLECAALAGKPGSVEVRARVRDSFGDTASGAGRVEVYAAGYAVSPWSRCRDGRRRREIPVTALTLDSRRAAAPPPDVEACSPP